MTTYVLHHDDNDGYCSALAAYTVFKDRAIYKAVQYGQDFPDFPFSKEDEVYIVDFSYSREVLESVNQHVGKLQVIDHHDTAMEQLQGLPYALFDMSKSGAELSWEYFNPGIEVPDLS